MTPTSPLAGLLVGLLDGLLIAVLVFVVVMVNNRRHQHRPAEVVHPVAADLPAQAREGELPKAFRVPD